MLTLEQRRLVLKEIRMIVDEAVESYKNAINEGLENILENEEMQEFFDQAIESISYNLSDEVWDEDSDDDEDDETESDEDDYELTDYETFDITKIREVTARALSTTGYSNNLQVMNAMIWVFTRRGNDLLELEIFARSLFPENEVQVYWVNNSWRLVLEKRII